MYSENHLKTYIFRLTLNPLADIVVLTAGNRWRNMKKFNVLLAIVAILGISPVPQAKAHGLTGLHMAGAASAAGAEALHAQAASARAVTGQTPLRSEQLADYPRIARDGGRGGHLYGYRFLVLKNQRITHLGGRFSGLKTVVLIDNSTKRVIAHADVRGSAQNWNYAPITRTSVRVVEGRSYTVAVRMGDKNTGVAIRPVDLPFRQGDVVVIESLHGYSRVANFHTWSQKLTSTDSNVMKGLVDVRYAADDGSSSSSSSSSGSSTGSSSGSSSGTISWQQQGNLLTVSSTKAPTWKLDFAIGSGAPGGGTATGLYIPASSSRSVVEGAPFRNCCSGLGLDNLEWRWRPFGSGNGTRSALGHSSNITGFRYLTRTNTKLEFELTGSWDGVSRFKRRTTVTPDGYSTSLSAAYSGTTGQDSMWWLIAMFHDSELISDAVTIQDRDTAPIRLGKTVAGTPLPSSISYPYTINYPLTGRNHAVSLTMTTLADGGGGGRFYEFFDHGNPHGIPIGPYYVIYPRWTSVLANRTYDFRYSWKLAR